MVNAQLQECIKQDLELEDYLALMDSKYDQVHKLNMYLHAGFECVKDENSDMMMRVQCPSKNDVFTVGKTDFNAFDHANKIWELSF